MNTLRIGLSAEIELPPGGFLYIDDDLPPVLPNNRRVFNPTAHCFNPLKHIDYKRARSLADTLYTLYPQGENTLTVRNGRRQLLHALLNSKRFNEIRAGEEAQGVIDDILASPLLRRVLTHKKHQFTFNPKIKTFARINRAELGDFDALALGLILMNYYKGQLIIPDFGFYGRDAHTNLVRENRLIAKVNYLDELPLRIRRACLLIKDKEARGALYDDAVLYAKLKGYRPDRDHADNDYDNTINVAMA